MAAFVIQFFVMVLWNVLHGKKEKFRPLKKGSARLYTCGPTVYDSPHIGNLRTFIFEDILRRSLKLNDFKVKQVMNITDIEDKIIKRAKREGRDFREITRLYTKVFFDDIKKVGIEKAEIYPKATTNIPAMIRLIQILIKKGVAYQGRDNSIYYNISKFKRYGALSGLKKKQLKIGARVQADEYNKNQAQDFVLWKSRKKGEPWWQSPWGKGRPGWHIECSAMSMKYLGERFDIHTGGVDNIFPHHENEIAQSEAATGKKFVNYWLEAEHLLVNNRKMAKSLKNFYILRDLEQKGFNPLSFRYLVLTANYRSKLNFTWGGLKGAEKSLNNLYKILALLKSKPRKSSGKEAKQLVTYGGKLRAVLNDDLNTPKALSILWQVLRDKKLETSSKMKLAQEFDKVLGLQFTSYRQPKVTIPAKVMKLVKRREGYRTNQQFIKADSLRKKVRGLGYKIEDTPAGPKVSKLK